MIITSRDKICIEEDFKIEAGPGAGKTEFLVNHIKNVLQNSTRLSRVRKVACITYTNTAVETILRRLGKGVSNQVEVSTIHSFLYRNVVKPYCSFIPTEYEVCSRNVKGHDEFYVSNRYINEWFENEDLSELRHPNTKNQILKMPAYNQALKNWLLSMQCVCGEGTVLFKCDNTKAVGYDKDNDTPLRLRANSLNILSNKIIGLKKIYWRKGKLDHNDVLFFSFVLIKKYPFILEVLRAKF
ncbi:MAG: AAA family ATPase, partial [Bacteroidaceae bacterium]|nr:AAA family ATPase [Bacteroidaceae bacterium]